RGGGRQAVRGAPAPRRPGRAGRPGGRVVRPADGGVGAEGHPPADRGRAARSGGGKRDLGAPPLGREGAGVGGAGGRIRRRCLGGGSGCTSRGGGTPAGGAHRGGTVDGGGHRDRTARVRPP